MTEPTDPPILEGEPIDIPNISKNNHVHKTLVALLARGASTIDAIKVLNLKDELTEKQVGEVKTAIEKGDKFLLCNFFNLIPEDLENILDNYVYDYSDIVGNPITKEDRSDHKATSAQGGALVLTRMTDKQLDKQTSPSIVANRILNRISYTVQQPITVEEIALLSDSFKKVASTGLCDPDELDEVGDLINDQL